MTELTVFQQEMMENLPEIDLKMNELLSKHTSFQIGGAAEVMAFPKTVEQLSSVLKAARRSNVVPRILGAGTNVLAPDEGVTGLVICLKNVLGNVKRLRNGMIRAYAGATMTKLANFAAKQGLSGLEFAHGIPGTVGGGVYMNAGAYGGEISQVCTQVAVMDMGGNQRLLTKEEMEFSYRNSRIQRESSIVLFADFSLQPEQEAVVRQRMRELIEKRRASQPLELPSAGSAFKRPAVGYAAALIDETGLKGFRVGGAAVSEKHAGFVVNLGQATANDVKSLLKAVADRVEEEKKIRLEPEIRIW